MMPTRLLLSRAMRVARPARAACWARALSAVPKAPSYDHVIPDDAVDANGGLLEYSVVYTDRALNHMSSTFQQIMIDLHKSLTAAYNTDHAVLIPGSGTFAMEAAARAFSKSGPVVVVRNGYFSYRWSQIFDAMGKADVTVVQARPLGGAWVDGTSEAVAPPPVEEVVATIRALKPTFVAAPHVETSAGILLPPDYIRAVGSACREVGAVFCLDGIASGTAWVDMGALGVDCYITAPQKGWSGPAAVGVCALSERAAQLIDPRPSSFSVDLAKWKQVMKAYLDGGHMYHATMATDAIRAFRDAVHETEDFGLDRAEAATFDLGAKIRKVLQDRGFKVVAAPGFEAPGVVVVHAPDATYAAKFKNLAGLQIAGGVPLMIGEPAGKFNTFRIGLFGLDKLAKVNVVVRNFEAALDKVIKA